MRGFSTIELLVVLTIAATMVTMAAPSFQGILSRIRLSGGVNDLFAAVNLTRAEAIARSRRVDIVPADGADWASGWVVFVDKNNDQVPGMGDQIIIRHEALPAGFAVTATFAAATPQYVAFNSSGHPRSNLGSQTTRCGGWLLTLGGKKRKILINTLGRTRVCSPDDDSGCVDSSC